MRQIDACLHDVGTFLVMKWSVLPALRWSVPYTSCCHYRRARSAARRFAPTLCCFGSSEAPAFLHFTFLNLRSLYMLLAFAVF